MNPPAEFVSLPVSTQRLCVKLLEQAQLRVDGPVIQYERFPETDRVIALLQALTQPAHDKVYTKEELKVGDEVLVKGTVDALDENGARIGLHSSNGMLWFDTENIIRPVNPLPSDVADEPEKKFFTFDEARKAMEAEPMRVMKDAEPGNCYRYNPDSASYQWERGVNDWVNDPIDNWKEKQLTTWHWLDEPTPADGKPYPLVSGPKEAEDVWVSCEPEEATHVKINEAYHEIENRDGFCNLNIANQWLHSSKLSDLFATFHRKRPTEPKEPTVEFLREWSATKVMGYPTKSPGWDMNYYDKGLIRNTESGSVVYWEPDSDLNQLALCVKAWAKGSLNKYEELNCAVASAMEFNIRWTTSAYFTKPELVLRAIYRVVEESK